MATKAAVPRRKSTPLSGRQYAAVAGQIASYWTTLIFVQALMSVPASEMATHVPSMLIALIVEYIIAKGKEAILVDGQHSDGLGMVCIIVDTLFNGGGLWGGFQQLDQTQAWQMLATSFGLASQIKAMPAMIIALVVGFLLSVAPHKLWK